MKSDFIWSISQTLFRIESRNRDCLRALCCGFHLGGPLREMIERSFVRAVEMEGSNGSRAFKDSRVIASRIDSFDVLLFMEPVEGASARIGAFLQHVAGDLLGLPRDADAAVPDQRHIHIEKNAVRHAFG